MGVFLFQYIYCYESTRKHREKEAYKIYNIIENL